MLEPYDGKLSRTVLRGAWGRKTLGPTRYQQNVNPQQEIDVVYLSLIESYIGTSKRFNV